MRTAIKRFETLAKAPSSTGTFDGTIDYNPPKGDHDGERIAEWANVPGTFPLSYQHSLAGDPGAVIGDGKATERESRYLDVAGQLSVGANKMADAVHERMLLPDSDPLALTELSVGFAYDPELVTTDANGVKAIHDAELMEISIVYRGAQSTRVTNVKALLADVKTGLVTYEAALKYAERLDVPPDIVASLIKAALPQEAKPVTEQAKNYFDVEPLEGSYEDSQEAILEAIQAWAVAKYPDAPGDYGPWVQIIATFPDHVVFGVCGTDKIDDDSEYFTVTYTYDESATDDDSVTLGIPEPVDVTIQVNPDADAGKTLLVKDAASGVVEETGSPAFGPGESTARAHLVAATPAGHGKKKDEVKDLSLEEMTTAHDALHSADGYDGHTHDGYAAGVDDGAWDGAAALDSCSSEGDFAKIAFKRAGADDYSVAAGWALPHHSSPGADPNAKGVSSALGALNGARGGSPDLEDAAAAKKHLEAHETAIAAAAAKAKAGRVIGTKATAALHAAIDAWVAEVNGTAEAEAKGIVLTRRDAPDEDELASVKARLDALLI